MAHPPELAPADGRPEIRPPLFLLLVLPYGIANGFATVLLPFLITGAGHTVAEAAAVVSLALFPNMLRALIGPVVDLTLTLRRWYGIGAAACAATVLLLGLLPIRTDTLALLGAAAFLSGVGSNLLLVPVGGMMALGVPDAMKGRAGGWYQAGLLGGIGLGGGAGIWLATHGSATVATLVLASVILSFAAVPLVLPELPRPGGAARIAERVRAIGQDLVHLVRSPAGLLALGLVAAPIGAGAAANLWSAVAPYWHASADLVALTTGALFAVASAVGSVVGGWIADRVSRWVAFFGAGGLMAATTLTMAAAPPTPATFGAGVVVYGLTLGMVNAAFSAILLYAIGRGAASTKYAVMSSVGNAPVAYMTALDGWAHDRFGAAGMLRFETAVGVGAVLLGVAAVRWVDRPRPSEAGEALA
jgi:MFS family permease